MDDADLTEAARREVASREKQYPALVQSGRHDLVADYQAWCVILKWLSTDRFETLEEGGFDGTTRIGWPECEEAAAKALASVGEAADAAADDAKALRLWARHAVLAAIQRKVSLRRQSIDDLNAHFAAQRQGREAA